MHAVSDANASMPKNTNAGMRARRERRIRHPNPAQACLYVSGGEVYSQSSSSDSPPFLPATGVAVLRSASRGEPGPRDAFAETMS